MEDFTETEDRETTPMEVTDTGEITEIGPLEEEEATERRRTGDIIDQRADMTGITIMRGTTEKEGEEMDFNNRSVSDFS